MDRVGVTRDAAKSDFTLEVFRLRAADWEYGLHECLPRQVE
jgi:hypothetical protein